MSFQSAISIICHQHTPNLFVMNKTIIRLQKNRTLISIEIVPPISRFCSNRPQYLSLTAPLHISLTASRINSAVPLTYQTRLPPDIRHTYREDIKCPAGRILSKLLTRISALLLSRYQPSSVYQFSSFSQYPQQHICFPGISDIHHTGNPDFLLFCCHRIWRTSLSVRYMHL